MVGMTDKEGDVWTARVAPVSVVIELVVVNDE